MLEKSRVVHQDKGERNYHIFYQYLAAASSEERKEFRLKAAKDYLFLNKSGVYKIEGVDDKKCANTTFRCLLISPSYLPESMKRSSSRLKCSTCPRQRLRRFIASSPVSCTWAT